MKIIRSTQLSSSMGSFRIVHPLVIIISDNSLRFRFRQMLLILGVLGLNV